MFPVRANFEQIAFPITAIHLPFLPRNNNIGIIVFGMAVLLGETGLVGLRGWGPHGGCRGKYQAFTSAVPTRKGFVQTRQSKHRNSTAFIVLSSTVVSAQIVKPGSHRRKSTGPSSGDRFGLRNIC
jgi:hypothetical protein